jgi:neurotransmitter:Na+ symporter, NSS family
MLATIGSAVGIGSIWKFPYEVGANGGSAFLLFYLLGLALIVVPLLFVEFAIGRRGRSDPAGSLETLAIAAGSSRKWLWAGALGVLTGFLILSFYSVIGGWTLGYALQIAAHGLPGNDAASVGQAFAQLLASPGKMLMLHAVFMLATAFVVGRGVIAGIESAVRILVPFLFVLLLLLAVWSMLTGDVAATARFLFKLDTRHLNAATALDALGLGFFSIGVGIGLMITYAAYSGAAINLKQVAIASVLADTAISFVAGFAVFPIVFAYGLDPASGPGLVFETLPLAFARMPYGQIAAVAFFILLFVAALASAISILEMIVAFIVGRSSLSRPAATVVAATACFLAGIATVLSFNLWSGWHPLAAIPGFERAGFFDLLDGLTSNVMLPVGGLLIAVFAGWFAPGRLLVSELGLSGAGEVVLVFLVRWLVPCAIIAVALAAVWR